MLYTEKEKHEIERVKEVFMEHLRQSPDFELLWSDKVGYVWLTIGVNPVYVDTGIRIESAADLCYKCLDDVAMDVLYMTGNGASGHGAGRSVSLGGDLQASIWSCAAYTVLLCFSLFKTGSVAKSILNAH